MPSHTKVIVCPACGHHHEDTFRYPEELCEDYAVAEMECSSCEKSFYVTVYFHYTYSTVIVD